MGSSPIGITKFFNMASTNKKRKLKNSYCIKAMLKNKSLRLRRVLFFTSSKRKENNLKNYNYDVD